MALPKIETPRHNLTLPVSGLKIQYRPFLVKEQKVLLQAMEMGGEDQIAAAVTDVASACTYRELRIEDLPLADVEYLMLQIRGKSVGETSELIYTCPHCDTKQPVTMSVTDVEVSKPNTEDTIMIYEDVGVKMRPVTYGEVYELSKIESEVERGYAVILASVEKVFDNEQVYTRNDFSNDELKAYLDDLPASTFTKIEQYVSNQPTVQKEMAVKCIHCDKESTYTAKGLSNFFH